MLPGPGRETARISGFGRLRSDGAPAAAYILMPEESHENIRPLEKGIELDLADRTTYAGYLMLDRVLAAQKPLSDPQHHDEMLFIIMHQVAELWIKLNLHELKAATALIRQDNLDPCLKILARVSQIQRQLFEQWGVLETLTPVEYVEFRDVLGPASGFQSLNYRKMEFLLGNKNAGMVKVFDHDPAGQQELQEVLESPSIYDEFLQHLARLGLDVPSECLDRDWKIPHVRNEKLVPVFKEIYEHRDKYWGVYHLCEKLVDIEESFQLWRFRHVKTVERLIGFKRGTGGSSGVPFLRRALDLTFFPELLDVRTEIGT